jgi:membrane-associated phospholipid phosphatase
VNLNSFKAIRASALLCLVFLIVYGTCNWITSLRTDVGTFYFPWERHIPFVPWMIVPYMSIDLFFIAAPFLCRNDHELRVLSNRIIFAIVVAGLCFLLFPLRFAFERPPVTGWFGQVFDAFRTMDKPFNLAPSLHIALRTILASIYARRTRGPRRIASNVWFSLIGFSTVVTYQHHLLDVAGGFVLAAYSFFLFPEKSAKLPVVRNYRVGAYYTLGAICLLALVWWLRSWSMIFLWPSASMAIVASAYFGLGPGIFRKENGRLPLSSRLVLAPCLFGQHLSIAYYRRQCRRWDEAIPGLWIGRKLNDTEAREATQSGITAVLDLTAEFDEARPLLNVSYQNIPILDLTAPTQDQLQQMANFITEQVHKGIVYVHCKIGYSRSAAAVGAYLLQSGQVERVEQIITKLRLGRPSIVIRPEIVAALRQFSETRHVSARF